MMIAELLLLQTRGTGWDLWIGLAIVALSIFGSIAQKAIQHFGGKKGEQSSDAPSGVPPVASPPPWQPAKRPSSAPPARPMPGAPPARPMATLQPRQAPPARPAPAKPAWQPPRPSPQRAPAPPPPPRTVPEMLGRVAESLKAKIEEQLHRETTPGPAPVAKQRKPSSAASSEGGEREAGSRRPRQTSRPTPDPQEPVSSPAFAEDAAPAGETAFGYATELRKGGAMALRKAIIYSEILGPPIAMRDQR